MTGRVAVLLGAGASADAGLPLTVSLAERVVQAANQGQSAGADWVRALNFVYGSMVGYAADDGNNPLDAVNIERLISALRLLQAAKTHEAAPFVASWKPGALGVGSPRIPDYLGRDVIRALSPDRATRGPSASSVTSAISQLARAATQTPGSQPFRTAEEQILFKLRDILSAVQTVEYLTPLAQLAQDQAGGLDVITLNYDPTIEELAASTNTPIDRGIERWTPGVELIFDQVDGRLNLYKLHGSLDWELDSTTYPMGAPAIVVTLSDTLGAADLDDYGRPRRPWIVVGEREKLSADGPMLALLRAAENALRCASHLVVVGYSFADPHINALIRDWLLADPARTIGIVEKTWRPGNSDFLKNLLGAFGSNQDGRDSRVIPTIGTANEVLAVALGRRPQPTPAGYVAAMVGERDNDVVRVDLSLMGISATSATVSVVSEDPDGGGDVFRGHQRHPVSLDREKLILTTGYSYSAMYLEVSDWGTAEPVQVYTALLGRTELTIELSVARIDSNVPQLVHVPLTIG
ncbi:SIR2 family protein [Plantibacter sp. LMC-P-059a]|uniref:SIR2 family protein n=1 Tax=Plantibacter sp. LMC-P-059a TaxID=3040297 RepID=UPI00254C87CF|nr:SIR2 family protein [Plantibacter sp. LMC-P-059a]